MQTDTLTGLLQFEDFLSQAGAVICDKSRKYLIAAADVGDFHYININYGYDIGDAILCDIADLIRSYLPHLILSCRSYSDHFIALVSIEDFDHEWVISKVQGFKDSLKQIISNRVEGVSPNMNVGIYFVEESENNIIAAVDKANVARRTSKGNYNIPCVVYSEHLMDIKESSAKILPLFDDSFKKDTIRVYLQPKISSDTKQIVGAEALSRLVDQDGNVIPPAKFIAALEKTGKIVELDFYVLTFVCKLIKKWINNGIEPVVISFNLSRIHFYSATVVDDIISIVKEYNVPPEYVEIEVTESVFFEETDIIVKKVEKLRKHGFKVSVDDFGAGYSSLNLIGVLPVDVVKLDKGFVKDSLKTKRGNDIIKGLINILNEIDLEIVCEGVETEDEEAVIKEYGCDEIQGFLYDKPIPASEFEAKYINV